MKNKELTGLLKYILMIVAVLFLPLLWVYSFVCIFTPGQGLFSNILALIGFILFLTLPIIHLLLPITVTVLAIKQHWNSYLDKFFNQFKNPSIVMLIIVLFIIIYEISNIEENIYYSHFRTWFYAAIVLPYCMIYFVVLGHNILRKFAPLKNNSTTIIGKEI